MRSTGQSAIIIAIMLMWSSTTRADSQQKSLHFSASSHDAVVNYYKPLVQRAYEKIGYQIEVSVLPEKRSLLMLEAGTLDGDIVRTASILKNSATMLPVWPLGSAKVFLICQQELSCNSDTLRRENIVLGTVAGNTYFRNILKHSDIGHVLFNRYEQLHQAFALGRIDMYIDIVNSDLGEEQKLTQSNHFLLDEFTGYHILHKKHQALIEPLKKSFNSLTQQQRTDHNSATMSP